LVLRDNMEYKTGQIFAEIFPDFISKGVLQVSKNGLKIKIKFEKNEVTLSKTEFNDIMSVPFRKLFDSEQKLTEFILKM
jgi:hypothetical protein